MTFLYLICRPGGVLRYISDGDVRSPFLGLKLAIWDFIFYADKKWTFLGYILGRLTFFVSSFS